MKKMSLSPAAAPRWNRSSILTRPPPANSASSPANPNRRTGTEPILRPVGVMTHVNLETVRAVNTLSRVGSGRRDPSSVPDAARNLEPCTNSY